MKTLRTALLVPGGLALLAGLDAALLLLGLPAPVTTDRLPDVHGGLLVLGFVGTLVALERAVALRRRWAFAAPALLGLGGLGLLTTAPLAAAQGLLVAGAAAFGAVYVALWRRQESVALAVQALGAVTALGAALLWWGGAPVPAVLPWFTGFVVLTIAGERLELSRVGLLADDIAPAERRVLVAAAGLVAAVVAATLWPAVAHPFLGAALLALLVVLVRRDVARRLVRAHGLPRYSAWCLLAGYAWLAVAGGVWLLVGRAAEGPAYDAVVHAVFLGFTISMIMGHAPVILPAVLGRALPYRPVLWGPVVLLHASLLLRVAGGDLHGQPWALAAGGAANVAAVLAFLVLAVRSVVRGTRPADDGARKAPVARPAPSRVEEAVR